VSLPEKKKCTWEVCVHTTAWERGLHFCWDFRRRRGDFSVQSCSAVLQWVPGEPQNWALGCPSRSSHLEQQNKVLSSLSAGATQHSRPSDWCLRRLTAGESTWPYRRGNSLQLPLLISTVLCFSLLQALSQLRHPGDTQSIRKLFTEHPNSAWGAIFPEDNSRPITNLLKLNLRQEHFMVRIWAANGWVTKSTNANCKQGH